MGQLGSQTTTAPAAPTPTSASPTATATEIVTRPDPGLARGKWEAPQWLFWVLLAVVVLGAAAYMLGRLGILKIKKPTHPDVPPASSRAPPSSRIRRP